MSDALLLHSLHIAAVRGAASITALLPHLQRLAQQHAQPGTMHGLDLLIGSAFNRRKRPVLLCFRREAESELLGAVLLFEYRPAGLPSGVFATGDSFGARTVVGPAATHPDLCFAAARYLLDLGGRLVLSTCRIPDAASSLASDAPADGYVFAASTRVVRDTLPVAASGEETLQTLGKRTRTHMRAARRHFNESYSAQLVDATAELASADDAALEVLNQGSMDVIDQTEFNRQLRIVCRGTGGFALGLALEGRLIALVGGWRQETSTWIEWQCNSRGFEKYSLGSVLRTYLFEEECRRGCTRLHFHGGTSHSMVHRFQQTPVLDLLALRPVWWNRVGVKLLQELTRRRPGLLRRGNFLLDALSAPGLRWSGGQELQLPDRVHSPSL